METKARPSGRSFDSWQKNLPGLRAVRMPKFGSDAGWALLAIFAFPPLTNSSFTVDRVILWGLFWCVGLPFAVVYLYRIGQTAQCAAYRLRNLPPPNQWSLRNALMQFVVTLPRLMLFLWFVIHLFRIHSFWLNWINYGAILVWLNYFVVGCAVAVRRGVDDLLRSRKRI